MTTATALEPSADPLYAQPLPERPAYATGMLLDAQDFSDEQTYHRGRLARAMGALAGDGTLAGLRVSYQAATDTVPEEIRVEPGVAVDRLGRLIELPRPACTRLARWFDGLMADGGDTVATARYDNLARFTSARAQADAAQAGATPLPARALVADVFVRFVACPRGFTPAFASGPYDALNAVSTSRLRDAYELLLVRRTDLGDDHAGVPALGPDFAALPDDGARRAALQDAVLGAWQPAGHDSEDGQLPARAEDPAGVALDRAAVFLARVLIPVTAADPPARDGAAVLVDNWSRRFVPASPLLARFGGGA